MTQKVATLRKVKSRHKTTFLGKIPTLTSKLRIGDKERWFWPFLTAIIEDQKEVFFWSIFTALQRKHESHKTSWDYLISRAKKERRQSQPLSLSNFSKLKFRQGQAIFAQFPTATWSIDWTPKWDILKFRQATREPPWQGQNLIEILLSTCHTKSQIFLQIHRRHTDFKYLEPNICLCISTAT